MLLQLEPLPLLIGVCFDFFSFPYCVLGCQVYYAMPMEQNSRGRMVQIHLIIFYNNMSQEGSKKCEKHGCHILRTSHATL